MKSILLKTLTIILLAAGIIIITGKQSRSEYIFLKNGEIFKGKILSRTAAQAVIRTAKGKVRRVRGSAIMRILYTNFYMGRQHVRLTDGRVLSVYKVDEDSDYIYFRKNLYKPQEIKIKRTRILFMARKNPNELKAKADYTSINLDWKPPIGTVKKYRIYIKKKGADNYPEKPAAETTDSDYTLENVKSSTDYCIVVTAVDGRGKESMPSNEVCLATKNYAPAPPKDLRYFYSEDYRSAGNKRIRVRIRWKAAIDRDGSILQYLVYFRKKDDKSFKLLKTMKLSPTDRKKKYLTITISELINNKSYQLRVVAVDNRKKKSDDSNILSFSTKNQPPLPPDDLLKKKISSSSDAVTWRLSWPAAKDRDGHIVKYIIYQKKGHTYRRIGKTKRLYFTTNTAVSKEKPIFTVRAVDNRGGISVNTTTSSMTGWHLTIEGACLLPLGSMTDIYDIGYGGLLTISYQGWPIENLTLGIKTGYLFFSSSHAAYENYTMIPVLAGAEYMKNLGDWFFGARFYAGMSYNQTSFNRYVYEGNLVYIYDVPDEGKSSFQPLIMAGLSVKYVILKHYYISGGVDYGGTIEKSGMLHFMNFQLGAGMRFF